MRLRRWMDENYERGLVDAQNGRRPDPSRAEHKDGRYTEMAYAAGYADGQRERRALDAFLSAEAEMVAGLRLPDGVVVDDTVEVGIWRQRPGRRR